MSKRTNEIVSRKRKKATAKADALWAVIEKTKLITQFFNVPEGSAPEEATVVVTQVPLHGIRLSQRELHQMNVPDVKVETQNASIGKWRGKRFFGQIGVILWSNFMWWNLCVSLVSCTSADWLITWHSAVGACLHRRGTAFTLGRVLVYWLCFVRCIAIPV